MRDETSAFLTQELTGLPSTNTEQVYYRGMKRVSDAECKLWEMAKLRTKLRLIHIFLPQLAKSQTWAHLDFTNAMD